MLKCAGNDDIITMKADDNGDLVTFMFETAGTDVPVESLFLKCSFPALC